MTLWCPRVCLSWLLICALATGCSRGNNHRPGHPPQNVLLVTTSALRKDHLSAYMYSRPTSAWPATEEERKQVRALALDDLAEQGVLFADASTNGPRTFPALCSLMTGTHASVAADPGEDRALENEATTIAERFREAGLRTAAFTSGVWLREARGLDQGFDSWTYRASDAVTIDQARQWLEQAEADPARPWFVWVHLAGCDPPYDPRGAPPLPGEAPGVLDFSRLYSDPNYSGPADGSVAYLTKLERGEAQAGDPDRARLVDLYDGDVARVAASVRTLVLSIRNLGPAGTRWRQTLFVFAGLHGVELGEGSPRAWGSARLTANVLSVPLLFVHQASMTGSRVMAEQVGIEDIAPTLCDWFGLPALSVRERVESGRSLLPVLDSYKKFEFEHRPAFAELYGPNESRSLRTREFALVETTQAGVQKLALFDRIADPAERIDIASSRPDVCAKLHAELELERAAFGVIAQH